MRQHSRIQCPVEEEARFFQELVPASSPDSELALNIIRAGDFLFDRFAGNFRKFGLSEAQFAVLVALEDVPGMTMAQIGRRMLVSRAGISGVIRGMVARKWVDRSFCEDDGRAVTVCITPAGRRLLEKVLPAHLKMVGQTVGDCYTAQEKAMLIDLLTRLRGRMARERAEMAGKQETRRS